MLLTLLLLCATFAPPSLVRGQESRDDSASSPQDDSTDSQEGMSGSPLVQGADLKTYYLLRENGELAPYFDMPFEEFEKLYRLYRGIDQAEQPNRFSVTAVSVTGRVRDSLVDLDVKITIRAMVDGWVRVPLRLDECTLRAPQSTADQNVAFLSVEDGGDGLVCWLEGSRGEETELRLSLAQRLEPSSGRSRLVLQLPSAAFSELVLDVPHLDAIGTPNDEATLQETSQPSVGWTRFTVLGRPGGFDFGWADRSNSAMMESHFVVTSQTSMLVETESQVRWRAALTVDGGGRNVDMFDVVLPQGAELLPNSSNEYVVESIANELGTDVGRRPRVRVRIIDPATRVEDVTISALVRWDPVANPGLRDVQLVEVVDAVQHSGRLDLFAASLEWVVDWELRGGLTRAAVPNAEGQEGIPKAGFAFTRQTGILAIRSERQPTRIGVEPVVMMSATRTGIEMDAVYRISMSGTPASRLTFDAPGWELDSVSSPLSGSVTEVIGTADVSPAQDLVRSFERDPEQPDRLIVNLNSDLLDGRNTILLQITGRLPLAPGLRQTELPIPMPVEAMLSSTTLLVRQEESLVIRPERTALQPVPSTTLPDWYVPMFETPPDAVFRGLLAIDRANVPFAISLRPRSVSYRTKIDSRIVEQSVQVRTEIDIDVKYQSMRGLDLLIPRKLLDETDVLVRHDSNEWVWTRADLDQNTNSPLAALPLEFDDGLLGRSTLEIEFQFPLTLTPMANGTENNGEQMQLEIPLVQLLIPSTPVPTVATPLSMVPPVGLLEAMLEDQRQHRFLEATISHPMTLDVQPQAAHWDRISLEEQQGRLISSFASSQPHPDGLMRFSVRDIEYRTGYLVSLEKSWLQTQLTKTDRQDRAVFRFRTDQPRIRIRLPIGAMFNQIALNNTAVRNPRVEEIDGRTFVSVSLAPEESANSQLIELWYRFSARPLATWPFTIDWPQIEGVNWVDRTYWQVILPRNEHLAWFNEALTPEHDWSFGPLLLERQARLDQAELEQWIGVSAQVEATSGSNVYLFSSFGEIEESEVSFIDRKVLFLAVCTITFVLGALLVYLRPLRSPLTAIGFGAILVMLAFVQMELSILVAQVALVTLVFVVIMTLIRAALGSPNVVVATEREPDVETNSTITRTNDERLVIEPDSAAQEVLSLSSQSESL